MDLLSGAGGNVAYLHLPVFFAIINTVIEEKILLIDKSNIVVIYRVAICNACFIPGYIIVSVNIIKSAVSIQHGNNSARVFSLGVLETHI